MYASHWGLSQSPFGPALDPRFFFESPGHEEALARLHFLVEQHWRLGLLLGSSGCGKSLLLEVFAQRMRARGCPVAKVGLLGIDADGFLTALADALRVAVPLEGPGWQKWRQLERRFREHRYQQFDTVLLLDDADDAAPEVLAQVARLVKHDPSPDFHLTVVLAGKAERLLRLGGPLLDLVELRIDLPAWDPSDTEAFLNCSMERAGGSARVFAKEAIGRMHALSDGSPRKIRQLADLALLAGAGSNLERVEAETVEAAGEQLGVLAP